MPVGDDLFTLMVKWLEEDLAALLVRHKANETRRQAGLKRFRRLLNGGKR